jgi:hypothetical protein
MRNSQYQFLELCSTPSLCPWTSPISGLGGKLHYRVELFETGTSLSKGPKVSTRPATIPMRPEEVEVVQVVLPSLGDQVLLVLMECGYGVCRYGVLLCRGSGV